MKNMHEIFLSKYMDVLLETSTNLLVYHWVVLLIPTYTVMSSNYYPDVSHISPDGAWLPEIAATWPCPIMHDGCWKQILGLALKVIFIKKFGFAFAFNIISPHRNDMVIWNLTSWIETTTYLYCLIMIMVTEVLGVKALPAIIPHPVASEHRWLVKAPQWIHSVPDVSDRRSWRRGCHARLWDLHDVTNASRL